MKKYNLFIIFLMYVVSFFIYPQLPSLVPMHWNLLGQIDSYMPKNQAVILWPLLTTFMYLMFQIMPKFDPKKEKYQLFQHEWQIIQSGLISFFAYLQLITFYISLHQEKSLLPLMFIGLGTLFVLIGNYLSKIRQNYFVGIRLPWTLADENNWNKTHRYASWCFVGIGFITLLESYLIWYAPIIIFGGILLSVILPSIYSFLIFKKQEKKMKFIYLIFAILALCVVVLRLASGEDDWICKDGQWLKHGNPTVPQPTSECK